MSGTKFLSFFFTNRNVSYFHPVKFSVTVAIITKKSLLICLYGKQKGSRRGIAEGMLNLAVAEVSREQYGDGAVFPCLISRESRGGQAGRGCDPVWRLRGSLSWWRLACLGAIHKAEVSPGSAAQMGKKQKI